MPRRERGLLPKSATGHGARWQLRVICPRRNSQPPRRNGAVPPRELDRLTAAGSSQFYAASVALAVQSADGPQWDRLLSSPLLTASDRGKLWAVRLSRLHQRLTAPETDARHAPLRQPPRCGEVPGCVAGCATVAAPAPRGPDAVADCQP